jgi:hypothetical protein
LSIGERINSEAYAGISGYFTVRRVFVIALVLISTLLGISRGTLDFIVVGLSGKPLVVY